MNNIFHVASTARRPGDATSDQLFVGEMTPHNAERPWLAIRGVALRDMADGIFGAAEPVAAIPVEPT